ncbi:helix-turn-helix transcriptional regulator [Sphingosinicella rhizophila]|uniref:Helix-turn-helix transcriptional regulator n=1 Tax=Sphingosinicella rhizophila TaxID=3050082 RepID=A0ABU3Q7N3_9SPHN|nr:helix-turn-helix transcriptional regulator [Sphingosinicella sp. GR2756]MDT9598993.1 helix-turn-helix transcriptional regulator [Sphingosinicella sp. GR2756]
MSKVLSRLLAGSSALDSQWNDYDGFQEADAPPQSGDWSGIPPDLWLDCWNLIDGNAHLLVTTERVLLCCDKEGQNELAREENLRQRRRRLETVDPSELKNLEKLLDVPEGTTNTYCLPARRNGGHLVMRSALLKIVSGMPVIGVTFHGTGQDFRPQWADVRSIFNLTSAEHRIVQMLLSGIGADGIATDLNLSINTVRTHIAHAYEKLGVSSRDELWRQLAPYRTH